MQGDVSQLLSSLQGPIRDYFTQQKPPPFVPGQTPIPLMIPSYSWEEVVESLDSLLSTRVTMGEKVRQFEALFAQYIGVKHAIMVNSGSSANLLALSILTNPLCPGRLHPGDEVITPAVTWATTVFPILNVGLIPVLGDVSLEDFNLLPSEVERAITPRTRAIMLVHAMGNPCDMDAMSRIAREHGLFLIEDTCEALGGEYKGRKVGSFGEMATFSFFFSHHITTIEGGMLVTDNDDYAELARSLRAHGWVRDLRDQESVTRQYPEVDPRYLFPNIGYNLRPSEIQGAFGIHQMSKLEGFIGIKRDNARFWDEELQHSSPYLLHQQERPGNRHVWFGYPLLVKPDAPFGRKELLEHLAAKGLETRPVIAGNIAEQPVMKLFPYRKASDLRNAQLVHRNGFYFGNHHGIGPQERAAIIAYIQEFLDG